MKEEPTIMSFVPRMLLGLILMAGLLTAAHAQAKLKDAYKDAFRIGAAVNQAQFSEADARGAALVKAHFNTITPENVLKWEAVHPQLDKYEFAAPDRYVAFGEKNKMFIIGHTLVWHNQTPRWVFQDDKGNPVDRDTLLQRMRDHIHTVVGRYKGRIKGWDVVNEALNEDPVAEDHRRRLPGQGVSVRARGRPQGRAVLQRLLAGERSQAQWRGRADQKAQGAGRPGRGGRAARS
jgi:GH35 family endo-1,4-beta-xylanase